MKELLLTNEIKSKFDKEILTNIFHYEHSKKNFSVLGDIIKKEPMTIHGMGMNVWNRIVQLKLKPVEPMALTKEVNESDPNVYRKISKIIGEPIFNEVLYSEAEVNDPALDYKTVNEIMIGHVYPNDIHLADIEFSNPYFPIIKSKRKSENQYYKGLGLLGQQIEKLIEYSNKNNFSYLTLTASSINECELFKKYGFKVEDNIAAQIGLKVGYGIPMEFKLNGY